MADFSLDQYGVLKSVTKRSNDEVQADWSENTARKEQELESLRDIVANLYSCVINHPILDPEAQGMLPVRSQTVHEIKELIYAANSITRGATINQTRLPEPAVKKSALELSKNGLRETVLRGFVPNADEMKRYEAKERYMQEQLDEEARVATQAHIAAHQRQINDCMAEMEKKEQEKASTDQLREQAKKVRSDIQQGTYMSNVRFDGTGWIPTDPSAIKEEPKAEKPTCSCGNPKDHVPGGIYCW